MIVYIVKGSYGEYGDYTEYIVNSFLDSTNAKVLLDNLETWLKETKYLRNPSSRKHSTLIPSAITCPFDPKYNSLMNNNSYFIEELEVEE